MLFSSLSDLRGFPAGGGFGIRRGMWVSRRQRRGERGGGRPSAALERSVLRCSLPACPQTRRAPPVHLVLPVLLMPVPAGPYAACPGLYAIETRTSALGARKHFNMTKGQVVLACVVLRPSTRSHPHSLPGGTYLARAKLGRKPEDWKLWTHPAKRQRVRMILDMVAAEARGWLPALAAGGRRPVGRGRGGGEDMRKSKCM